MIKYKYDPSPLLLVVCLCHVNLQEFYKRFSQLLILVLKNLQIKVSYRQITCILLIFNDFFFLSTKYSILLEIIVKRLGLD